MELPYRPQVTLRWQEAIIKGILPEARWAHSGVSNGSQIFIFGGYSGGSYCNDLWRLDLNEMKWYRCQTLSAPSIRGAQTATILSNNNLIIFGGYEGNTHLSDMYLVDTTNCDGPMKWTKIEGGGLAPSPRRGHSASLVGNNIFFFGGYNGSIFFNDLFHFDTVRMQWSKIQISGRAPCPRWLHAETVVGTDIYIFGGASVDSKQSDLWKFDTIRKEWTQIIADGERPSKHWGHSMSCVTVNYRPHLLVFGGNDGGKYLNCLHIFDTVQARWLEPASKGSPPSVRWLHSACVANNKVFCFGGSAGTGHFLNDLHILSIDNESVVMNPQQLFFKSLLTSSTKASESRERGTLTEILPAYDLSSITNTEKSYGDAIRATKECYQAMIEKLTTLQTEVVTFLQKQCTTMTSLLDDNMHLKIEQNVMKIKQDYNENLRLTEENLRLAEEVQQLKNSNAALNEQLKNLQANLAKTEEEKKALSAAHAKLKQDYEEGLKVYQMLTSLENMDKLSLDELQQQKQQYDALIKNIEAIKEKKLEAFVIEIAKRKTQEETKCIICYEKPRSMVFVQCGHMCACEKCAPTLKCCPVCRKDGPAIKIFHT
jgi:N-acetylneuraminic acid mutarotase